MEFIIQTIDNEIVHDFSFHLIEAIKYQRWYNNQYDDISYKLCDVSSIINHLDKNFVPVGSVEFVQEYMRLLHIPIPLPINVPYQLNKLKFTKREVLNGFRSDIPHGWFFKSNAIIKGVSGLYNFGKDIPDGHYQFSPFIDMKAEYRVFVFHNQIKGIQYYSGDFSMFPNMKYIEEMINEYTHCPVAYTLDVSVLSDSNDLAIVEVHDFFSCGLYGFSDYTVLPQMFSQWWFEYLRESKKWNVE